jgi:hypothetical protein
VARAFLQSRSASAAEAGPWQGLLYGGLSRAAVAAAFLTSPEDYRHDLDNYYANLSGQAGLDPGGAAVVTALPSGPRPLAPHFFRTSSRRSVTILVAR